MPPQPSHAEAYEYYFSSGYYDARYPRPNVHVLNVAQAALPAQGGHVIDFGCGSGRYTLPFLARAETVASFDICTSARARLVENLDALEPPRRPVVLGPERDSLERHVLQQGPADVVLALFGVIAHVEGAENRRELLAWLASLVSPQRGRVILSVPNRARRFKPEQRARHDTEGIRYVRNHGQQALRFFYKLYDVADLRADLEAAGLEIERLYAESLLPESWLANAAPLGQIDRWISRRLPARYGYGLLAVARPTARVDALCAPRLETRATCG